MSDKASNLSAIPTLPPYGEGKKEAPKSLISKIVKGFAAVFTLKKANTEGHKQTHVTQQQPDVMQAIERLENVVQQEAKSLVELEVEKKTLQASIQWHKTFIKSAEDVINLVGLAKMVAQPATQAFDAEENKPMRKYFQAWVESADVCLQRQDDLKKAADDQIKWLEASISHLDVRIQRIKASSA